MNEVPGSRRFVRAYFLPVAIPSIVVMMGIAPVALLNINFILGAIVALVCVAVTLFVIWWGLRSLWVGMWTDETTFVAKGWRRNYRIPRSSIDKFEYASYQGNTLVWLAGGLVGMGEFTVVRVCLTDGAAIDVQSSFARLAMTRRQVAGLNAWLGRLPAPVGERRLRRAADGAA